MGRKYTAEEHEEYRRVEDERLAKEAQERLDRTEKEAARRGFIREGGTEEQFEQAWPELRDRARHQRTLDREKAAREAQRAHMGSRI